MAYKRMKQGKDSVGVVIYRDGEKVDEFYSLIKPEPEYYNYWCSKVN